MSNLFSVIKKENQELAAPKVKGKRELKNLDCSLNFKARGRRSSQAKCQRRQGFFGSKNTFTFPRGAVGGLGWFWVVFLGFLGLCGLSSCLVFCFLGLFLGGYL